MKKEKIKVTTIVDNYYVDDDGDIHIGFSMTKESDFNATFVNIPDLVIPVTDATLCFDGFGNTPYIELPSNLLQLKKANRNRT